MQDDDFVSLTSLDPYFKKSVPGIQTMQWLHFIKEKPTTLFYKRTASGEIEQFQQMEMKKRTGRNPVGYPELQCSRNQNVKIKEAKHKNLLELLIRVPPVHHQFFKTPKS